MPAPLHEFWVVQLDVFVEVPLQWALFGSDPEQELEFSDPAPLHVLAPAPVHSAVLLALAVQEFVAPPVQSAAFVPEVVHVFDDG